MMPLRRSNFLRLLLPLLGALAGTVPPAGAQTVLESVKLHYVSGERAASQLQPLLAEGEAVIPARGEVLLNAQPANLARYRDVIAALDVPQRLWRIEVRQGDPDAMKASDYAASGDVTVASRGQSGVVIVGEAQGGAGQRILSQSLQLVEGATAGVSLGNARPLRLLQGNAQGTLSESDVTIAAQSGFALTPHSLPNGAGLRLDIAPRLALLAARAHAGVIAHSSIELSPGQWVTVALTPRNAAGADGKVVPQSVVQLRVTEVTQ